MCRIYGCIERIHCNDFPVAEVDGYIDRLIAVCIIAVPVFPLLYVTVETGIVRFSQHGLYFVLRHARAYVAYFFFV